MRVPRIYQSMPLKVGESIKLDAQAVTHVVRVLRLKQGDQVTVFNGDGGEYSGVISEVTKRDVEINLLQHQTPGNESPLYIGLIQGVSRGERMDYTLQKAVELGVRDIYPVFTEFTSVHLNSERKDKKIQHWQGVVNSACEQSGRNVIPSVHAASSLYACLDNIAEERYDLCLVLNHRSTQSMASLNIDKPVRVMLVAGPEGGLSQDEVGELERRSFVSVNLGPRVLRTETAALAAIAILQSMWGDFS